MIEPATSNAYGDSNKLEKVVTPDDPLWQPIMNGEAVPAEPSVKARRKTPEVVQPAWQQAVARAPAGDMNAWDARKVAPAAPGATSTITLPDWAQRRS